MEKRTECHQKKNIIKNEAENAQKSAEDFGQQIVNRDFFTAASALAAEKDIAENRNKLERRKRLFAVWAKASDFNKRHFQR